MARIHRMKTLVPHFDHVRCGRKTFEVRKDDRGFADGDYLVLDEWSPTAGYTQAKPIVRLVVHLLRGGQFGIADGYVVMGIDELADNAATRTVLDVAYDPGGRGYQGLAVHRAALFGVLHRALLASGVAI